MTFLAKNISPVGLNQLATTFTDYIHVNLKNQDLLIYLDSSSGKVIYRNKIDTIIGIEHPGIVLGKDFSGTTWVVHNHYKIGHPEIVKLEDFSDGAEYLYDSRPVSYTPREIVDRAIQSWKEKKKYSWLSHNCQQFVNKIVMNKDYSEALDTISSWAIAVGGVLSLYGVVTGNKTAMKIGLAIGGAGVVGKAIN